MHRFLRFVRHPDARGPLLAAMLVGVVVGNLLTSFLSRNRSQTYLLREIRESVNSHSCSSWGAGDARDREEEIYRAVARALAERDRSTASPGT